MPTDTLCFHVAIIGPSDTADEVAAIQQAIGKLSTRLSKKGVAIAVHHWTHLPPGIGEPQGYIDDGLAWADIDFVVGVMRHKFGTPVRTAKSGTEHEVRRVLELHSKHGSPDLLFWFHKDARKSSTELAEFAAFLRARALTSSYDDVRLLASSVSDSLRDKIEAKNQKPTGVPQMMGKLPANRRITVEWITAAQMQDGEKGIPSLICFKNGNGDEFIYDCRVPNFQDFADWIMKSMGFAPKEGDCLLRHLKEKNSQNIKFGNTIAQLWLGNVMFISHNKLGDSAFKILLGHVAPPSDDGNEALFEMLREGQLPFPKKEVYIDTNGKKVYKA